MVTTNQTAEVDPLDLMLSAKNGNHAAFGQLYEQYLTPVYRYVLVRISDTAAAEDITQTVFLKVYKSLSRYQPKSASPLALFFTVARNAVIDYWKKKKELPLLDAIDLPDETMNLAERTDTLLAQKEINKLLSTLTPEQQEIINLKFIAGLSNQEVATLVGKSTAAVRQLQYRALKTMRKQLNFTEDL